MLRKSMFLNLSKLFKNNSRFWTIEPNASVLSNCDNYYCYFQKHIEVEFCTLNRNVLTFKDDKYTTYLV